MSNELGEIRTKRVPAEWEEEMENHEDKYEAFYDRAFSTKDIDEIYKKGGTTTLDEFFNTSKDNVKNRDYWNAMFPSQHKGHSTLGYAIFDRFFKTEEIGRNKAGKPYMRAVYKREFNNKIYKGGMLLPKTYLTSRIKR